MAEKSKVKTIFPHFFKTIQSQFQTTIKNMRTNDGGEFLALKDLFFENGIIHQTTIPYTSQQNGE